MRTYTARVTEIHLQPGRTNTRQGLFAGIACPRAAIPHPGQYTLAFNEENVLGAPLFYAGAAADGFRCAPSVPAEWKPGTPLTLYGPLGNRFRIPAGTTRLALIAIGESPARLLPLATGTLTTGAVALFTNAPLPQLPSALEAYPLDELPDALAWANFLAIDTPVERLQELRERLVDYDNNASIVPGQILVHTAMPCAGIGACGVCAIQTGRSLRTRQSAWKLACQDGPVFDLQDLI
jgi:NAD(P)H-flavin reductase